MSRYPAYKGPLVLPEINAGKPLVFPDPPSSNSGKSKGKSSAESEPKIDALTGDGKYWQTRTQEIQAEMSNILSNYGLGNISYAEKYDSNYKDLKNELNYMSTPAYFNELKRRKEERTSFLGKVTEGDTNKGNEIDLDYWFQTGELRTFDYVLNAMEHSPKFDYSTFNEAQDLTTYGEALDLILKEFNDIQGSTGWGNDKIKRRLKTDYVYGGRESVYQTVGGQSGTSNKNQLTTKANQQARQPSKAVVRGLLRGFLESGDYQAFKENYKGDKPINESDEFYTEFEKYKNRAIEEALTESIKSTYSPGVDFVNFTYTKLGENGAKKWASTKAASNLFLIDGPAINTNVIFGLTDREKKIGYLDGPIVKKTINVGEWYNVTQEDYIKRRMKEGGITKTEALMEWNNNNPYVKENIPLILVPDKNGNVTFEVQEDAIALTEGAQGVMMVAEVQRIDMTQTAEAFGAFNETIAKANARGEVIPASELGGTSYFWDPVSGNYFTGGMFDKEYISILSIGTQGGYKGDNIKPAGEYNEATGNITYNSTNPRTAKEKAYYGEMFDKLMKQGRIKEAYQVGNMAITSSISLRMPIDRFAEWGEETTILGVTNEAYHNDNKQKVINDMKRLGYKHMAVEQKNTGQGTKTGYESSFTPTNKFWKMENGVKVVISYEDAVTKVLSNRNINKNYGAYLNWIVKKKAGQVGGNPGAGYTQLSDGKMKRHWIANELVSSFNLVEAKTLKNENPYYQINLQRDMMDVLLSNDDVRQDLNNYYMSQQSSSTGTGNGLYGVMSGF